MSAGWSHLNSSEPSSRSSVDMVDAGIGRLLIASLHQGIADVAPSRLEFYENWLSPTGLRDGRLGLAPLGAVLSFLHREGPPDNDRIPDRAGACAADWTLAGLSGVRLALRRRLPIWWRSRAALAALRRFVRETIRRSKVKTRFRAGRGAVEIQSAAFEYLRDPASIPMRRFYAAAFTRLLHHYALDGEVAVDPAAAAGCRLIVTIRGARGASLADAA
jgi:hypothetical protein